MSKSNNAFQCPILSVSVDNVSKGSNYTRKQFKFFYERNNKENQAQNRC